METKWRVSRENEVLQGEVKRLRIELEEAKRQAGGVHGDFLMHSVVDSLLHQAKSISALISEQERYIGPRHLGSVIKKY